MYTINKPLNTTLNDNGIRYEVKNFNEVNGEEFVSKEIAVELLQALKHAQSVFDDTDNWNGDGFQECVLLREI